MKKNVAFFLTLFFSCIAFSQQLSFKTGVNMYHLEKFVSFSQSYTKTKVNETMGIEYLQPIYKRWGIQVGINYETFYIRPFFADCWVGASPQMNEKAVSTQAVKQYVLEFPIGLNYRLVFGKKTPLSWQIYTGWSRQINFGYKIYTYSQTKEWNTPKEALFYPSTNQQLSLGTSFEYPISQRLRLGLGGKVFIINYTEGVFYQTYFSLGYCFKPRPLISSNAAHKLSLWLKAQSSKY